MKGFRGIFTLLLGTLLCFYFSQAVFAVGSEDFEFTLEEITVTATKRETNLQNTAVSATAIPGDVLLEEGKYKLEEILEGIAGISMRADTHGAKFFIRGVVENFAWTADPVTATYSDGVYVANPGEARSGFYDMQRLEVLRGPQGTLYGFNAMGGSVNLISNDPKLDGFEARGSIEVGNYSLIHTEGAVNIPLNDTFALRTAFAVEQRDGYLSNGQNDSDMYSGRVKLLYKPNERFQGIFSTDYTKSGGHGIGSAGPHDVSEGAVEDLSDPWYTDIEDENISDQKTIRVYAKFDLDLDFASLTYQPTYTNYKTDMDHYIWDIGNRMIDHRETKMTSHELRLNSKEGSIVTWVTGINYVWRDTPVTFITNTGGNYSPMDKTVSKGIFGQLTYPVMDWLRLTGGLRYSVDEKKTQNKDITAEDLVSAETSFKPTTWKAGFEADVSEDSMIYFTLSTGYRAGGHIASQGALQEFKTQELLAYQFGSKNRFFNDSLQVNAEVFYYPYKNYQLQYGEMQDGEWVNVIVNSDKMTSYGGEVEVSYILTKADKIDFSIANLNSDLGKLPGALAIYSDYPLDHSPEWSVNMNYAHTWSFSNNGTLTMKLSAHYETESWMLFKEPEGSLQPSYHKSDLSLLYGFPSGKWNLQGYVRNIEDYPVMTHYVAFTRHYYQLEAPRTYGLVLSVKY